MSKWVAMVVVAGLSLAGVAGCAGQVGQEGDDTEAPAPAEESAQLSPQRAVYKCTLTSNGYECICVANCLPAY
jgi:hypothetical protein